jgi:hypothetical protein
VYRGYLQRYAPRDIAMKAGGLGKRCGVKAGIPDNIILVPPPNFPEAPGVVLELKTKTGTVSPEQKKWLASFEELGWKTYVCRSYDEFDAMLKECGYE